MRKISISRNLEEKYLKSILFNHPAIKICKVVDLGGELNHYNRLLKAYFGDVITYNLKEKEPDRIVDLTKDFYPDLCLDSPNCIVSINTIEHLPEDTELFKSCLKYVLNHSATIYIICPFMHKVHAAPHDYRRYTMHGLEQKIYNTLLTLGNTKQNIDFDIAPIGGSIYDLLISLIHQKSRVIGTLASPPLHAIDKIEKILRKVINPSARKFQNYDYALGHIVTLTSSRL